MKCKLHQLLLRSMSSLHCLKFSFYFFSLLVDSLVCLLSLFWWLREVCRHAIHYKVSSKQGAIWEPQNMVWVFFKLFGIVLHWSQSGQKEKGKNLIPNLFFWGKCGLGHKGLWYLNLLCFFLIAEVGEVPLFPWDPSGPTSSRVHYLEQESCDNPIFMRHLQSLKFAWPLYIAFAWRACGQPVANMTISGLDQSENNSVYFSLVKS